ncbi:unnamed protein product, partial [Laminaria digitata]
PHYAYFRPRPAMALSGQFRAPAWCDRILFWTPGGGGGTDAGSGRETAGSVQQVRYSRSETPVMSDHKPVSSSFRFACKQVRDPRKRALL